MSARIIVTLVCEYEGEDVGDYDRAMEAARTMVDEAGEVIERDFDAVRVLEVTVTG